MATMPITMPPSRFFMGEFKLSRPVTIILAGVSAACMRRAKSDCRSEGPISETPHQADESTP
jgi:hypothetical protein